MASSLKYGGLELLGGPGGLYNVTTGNRDFGDPKTVVSSVAAQLTMGSAVTGRFTDNRHIKLDIIVMATSRPSLAAACEDLAYQVDQSVNTLVWTPLNGLVTVFDCWRGQVTSAWNGTLERGFIRGMTIEFDALPFGRSDVKTTISGSSGTIALADFSTPTGFTYKTVSSTDTTLYPDLVVGSASDVASVPTPTTGTNHAAVTSPSPVEGSGSTQVDANWYKSRNAYTYTTITEGSSQSGGGNSGTYTVPAQGTAAVAISPASGGPWNLAANTSITAAIYSAGYAQQAVFLKLTDSHGASQEFQFTIEANTSAAAGQWDYFTVDISGATIDLTAVTGWALTVAVGYYSGYTTGLASTPIILGRLRAYPRSSTQASTANAGVFKFASIPGSAQANVTLEIDRGGTNTMSGILAYRAPSGTPSTTPIVVPLTYNGAGLYIGNTVAPTTLSGTYRVLLAASASLSGGQTLTITQKLNGTQVGSQKTLTCPTGTAKWFDLGEMTFPLADVPTQATSLTYSFSYNGAAFSEVILMDTRGSIVWVPALTAASKYLWIDEATAINGLGGVYAGNASDRSDAISQLGASGLQMSGAFALDPGDNFLMLYCPDGLPNISASFYPRWLHERSG